MNGKTLFESVIKCMQDPKQHLTSMANGPRVDGTIIKDVAVAKQTANNCQSNRNLRSVFDIVHVADIILTILPVHQSLDC